MIMKTLTTMRSNHIIISILYPLVKLMTLSELSELLELFELFNTVFDKEISISHLVVRSTEKRVAVASERPVHPRTGVEGTEKG